MSTARAAFYQRYYDTIARKKVDVDTKLGRLSRGAG